jgi:AmmeMemoRadiSam system protein B
MSQVRRAAVAGRWYPDDVARLAAELDRYLAHADVEPMSSLRAVIAPHAGLMYSGPVAAYAYKTARAHPVSAVVLVGPSHFVPFPGISIWPYGAWETPFGRITVAEDLAAALMAESDEIAMMPSAHGREHSIEMQLPFVAHLMPGVPIVPMVMGHQTRTTAFGLGQALGRAIRSCGANALLVASSDLSHYEDSNTAARLDAVVMERIEVLDVEGLMHVLEEEPGHACGGGPIVAVLDAARRLGASQARVLRYGDSGDVSGDKSSVVGYMAAAIW